MMTPHGPDVDAFEKASNAELKPVKLDATLVCMLTILSASLVWGCSVLPTTLYLLSWMAFMSVKCQ